jgi:RNA polymerase sigma-70 factor (ECF subfamily)
MSKSNSDFQSFIDQLYRSEGRKIFATLLRLLQDFDLAEDALQDAFASAMEQWPVNGIPEKPAPWLVSVARFKAIDRIRRTTTFPASALADLTDVYTFQADPQLQTDQVIQDDMLRLIFCCCHPALSAEAAIAMTLREVCDMTTEAIAHAFLVRPATIAQRIVRAKAKVRAGEISLEAPLAAQMQERLPKILKVIYLVFNEGYYAAAGSSVVRVKLAEEAIQLNGLLYELLPLPEVAGLWALMLLHEARRAARFDAEGITIPLSDQDRSKWNKTLIGHARDLLLKAFASPPPGTYALQAAIAALHMDAEDIAGTDWHQIIALYNQLLRLSPNPVVMLNRAIAWAMVEGPQSALNIIDALEADGQLPHFPHLYTAKADLLIRIGKTREAEQAWRKALELSQLEPEREFILRKLAGLK